MNSKKRLRRALKLLRWAMQELEDAGCSMVLVGAIHDFLKEA